MMQRLVLVGALAFGIAMISLAFFMAFEVARTPEFKSLDFIAFISATTVLSGTALAVGVTILWRKPGNRIGTLLVTGALLLISVFTAWPTSLVVGASGDARQGGLVTLWGIVALVPAIVILFPAVGILFPDERLPGPGWRWRWPIVGGFLLLATGVSFQTFAPWDFGDDVTVQNPLAIDGLTTEISALGGGLAAIGAFILFGVAVGAVVVRYRRSSGVERAQQKWLVASLGTMAIIFPLSFATDLGSNDPLDVLSVLTGALVPIAVGVAVLRYHVFEIDRVVSRGIAYGLLTAVLVATYAAVILLLQGLLGTILGGDTVSVALSTLVVAALFQPLRGRVQHAVDRRFDRARFDADLTSAAFSERLRDEVDIGTVAADLDRTVRDALKPAEIGLWLRSAGRAVR